MKRRKPPVPITSPAFIWVPPDADYTALLQRQRARIAAMQKPAATVAQIKRVRQA